MPNEVNNFYEYARTSAENAQLAVAPNTVDPLRDVYREVALTAEARMVALLADPDIKAKLAKDYLERLYDLNQLDRLEGFITDGMVLEETVTSARDRLVNTPEFMALSRHIGGVVLEGSTSLQYVTTLGEVGSNEDPHENGEKVRQALSLTINGSVLTVSSANQHGITVVLNPNYGAPLRDYAEDIIKLLENTVRFGGDGITTEKLVRTSFPDQPTDHLLMDKFRRLTDKLTFNKEQIIVHNGRNSRASGYYINPSFRLALLKAPELVAEEHIATKDREIVERDFPLSTVSSAVVAGFIDLHNDLISQTTGAKPIPENVISSLEVDLKDVMKETERLGIEPNLRELRKHSLEKLQLFFQDRDRVIQVLEKLIEENDPRMFLLEYLLEIEENDRWGFLQAIADSEITIVGGQDIRSGRLQDLHRTYTFAGGEKVMFDRRGSQLSGDVSRLGIHETTEKSLQKTKVLIEFGDLPPRKKKFIEEFQPLVSEWLEIIVSNDLEFKSLEEIVRVFDENGVGNLISHPSFIVPSKELDDEPQDRFPTIAQILEFIGRQNPVSAEVFKVKRSRSKPDRRIARRVISIEEIKLEEKII